MSELFWLLEGQVERLKRYLPKSRGKYVLDAAKNQPYNMKPISAELNNWLSRRPALARLGGPSWAEEVAGGGALAVGGSDDCSCQR
jgi:hypothetical protein